MSTSETDPSSATEGGSWWSSWLSSAKEKSMSALNATKRDLSEFVSVISTDTKAAMTGATTNIRGLLQEPGEEKPKEAGSQQRASLPAIVPDTPPFPYDRWQAQLFALQTNTDTYLTDPKDEKAFSEWQSGFDVQAQQSEVSSLLVSCSHVRTLHARLVPAKVSYEAFWQRYFYKVQLLQQEEERRMELMARAKPREEMWKWDEDPEEVGSMDALKINSEHPRSESSDSFVCVSEEPVVEGESEVGGGATEEVDSEDWEWLEGVGEKGGGGGEEGERGRGGGEEGERGGGGGEEGEGGGREGSKEEEKDSDWENWED